MDKIIRISKKAGLATLIVLLTLTFAILIAACNLGENGVGSSISQSGGGGRAWLDQPASDATLPLAPFKFKAHATQKGGGISQIIFLANSLPVGTVSTDASQDLVSAELDWNPAEPGEYAIQAKAITASGEALSGVAHLCIASATAVEGACAVKPQPPAEVITITPTPTDTPTPVKEITLNPSSAPDPVYYGMCVGREPQSLVIQAKPNDVTDVVEVLGRAWVESHNGSRDELPRQAMQKDANGGYSATFDLSQIDIKMLESQAGRVVYTVSLVNKNQESYAVSPEQSVVLLPCEATPTPVVEVQFKLSPSPDPVYIGACKNNEPQSVTFDGYLSDDKAVAKARVKVDILNSAGTQNQLFDQEMTKSGDHYTTTISIKDVNPKLLDSQPGRLIFIMSLIDDIGKTYATSYKAAIRVLPCIYTAVPVQPVEPEQPEEAAPQDTTPPTIGGGGPSSSTAYYDPKGIDPKRCQPTNVSFQVTVKDNSKLSSVVVYWYWASAGSGRTQSASLIGRSSTYAFTFSPTKGDDKLFYYVKAADVYNNVAQSGLFSFAVISCKSTTIIKPRTIVTPPSIIKPRIIITVPPIILKPPTIK